ncbi:MAG TPA: neutral/alkaline non-lysosomal ceramidase N-terminal domain-containing protein [Sandaracinaceae bacterium LLY-WYZ-13_1]|nr:neutral/alkaline non-lysosomal ceramidase N-terminal domain-containing protein [Sandaracinaceae bacterium LLY-WYZ-13_1]
MEAGFGRADLTVYERGMGMLGWGRPDNVALGVAAPLAARAMAVRDDAGRTGVYACADLCFVSASLRVAVLEALERRRLGLVPADVLLTATHTHSGPSGYSHAFFYDLSGPGYCARVLASLADGLADAIAQAVRRLAPARLALAAAPIPEGVAFNRSPDAFARNPEARRGAAVDRTVTVLRADDRGGRPLGALSLFALHATCVHGDGTRLHPDHKGLAAEGFEAWARAEAGAGPEVVAVFGQGAAGDVSPNHRFDPARGLLVGRFDDDLDSAVHVADAQVRASAQAWRRAGDDGLVLDGPVGGALRRIDLEARPLSDGGRTSLGRLGLAMAEGTAEGPGPLGPLRRLDAALHRARRSPDPKMPLLEIGPGRRRRLFGRLDPAALPLPHPAFAHARRARDTLEEPWIPTVLPVQLLRIGAFVLAALPNEPTTVAGRRLRRRLERALRPHGVARVHVTGYANAYAGYLTTPEEYRAQRYEGAYTLFGPRTLDAFAEAFDGLAPAVAATRLDGPPLDEGPPLPRCSEAQLRDRAFRPGG